MAVDTTRVSRARYDLLHPDVLEDPYAVYARLRSEQPVYRDRRFGWVVTRYDDVATVLRHSGVSAHRPLPDDPVPLSLRAIGEELRELRGFQALWLLYADPPEHTRLRALVSKAFTPLVVERLGERVQDLVDQLLAVGWQTGRLDLVRDLAYPLPALVIADLLGLPAADREMFQGWSDDIAAGMPLFLTRDALDGLRRAHHSQCELMAYFRGLIAERRARPADDLLSALVRAEENGTILSEDELLATCVLLLFAGHETTTNLIGNGLLALLRHPEQLARLRREPALLGGAVEELLRYDSPVQGTARRATAELELRGQRIGVSEYLLLLLGAANRDPAHFSHPDQLDITRADNRHLAFGHGPHFCLGAALARLEARITIGSVLERCAGLELAGVPTRRPHFYLRGLTSLPVAFEPQRTVHGR